jgi:hypothetical protein
MKKDEIKTGGNLQSGFSSSKRVEVLRSVVSHKRSCYWLVSISNFMAIVHFCELLGLKGMKQRAPASSKNFQFRKARTHPNDETSKKKKMKDFM